MPSFIGGEEAMYKFVNSNIQFSGEQPFIGENVDAEFTLPVIIHFPYTSPE